MRAGFLTWRVAFFRVRLMRARGHEPEGTRAAPCPIPPVQAKRKPKTFSVLTNVVSKRWNHTGRVAAPEPRAAIKASLSVRHFGRRRARAGRRRARAGRHLPQGDRGRALAHHSRDPVPRSGQKPVRRWGVGVLPRFDRSVRRKGARRRVGQGQQPGDHNRRVVGGLQHRTRPGRCQPI